SRRRHTRFSRDWSSDVALPIYHLLADRGDPHQPCLPEVAFDVVLLREAVSAVHTDRHVGRVEARLGGEVLRLVGLLAARDVVVRSEERRVGKQGGGRAGTYAVE